MIVRYLAASIRITALILLANAVWAQDDSSTHPTEDRRFVSVGQLTSVTGADGTEPRYALMDENGSMIARLKSASGVDLAGHVGHEVGVTSRTLVDGPTPLLLAESITDFGKADPPKFDRSIALAQYAEEVLPETLALPSAVGPVEYGPAIGTPIVTSGATGVPCESCGSPSCDSSAACPCGLPGVFWLRSEYLIWWTEGMRTPPLVTSSPAGTPVGDAGVLGTAGVGILYGDEKVNADSRSGARFRIGKWWDECNWMGFETDFFFLADEDQNFSTTYVGPQIYARPFVNTDGGQDSELVQYPGVVNGIVSVEADTSLWTISPRVRINLACEKMAGCDPYNPCQVGGYRLDMLAGYRYMRLDDSLVIKESLATVDSSNPTYFGLQDSFNTANDFHGLDLGLLWEGYRGPWSLEFITRLGLGNTRQKVSIDGATRTIAGGATFDDPGGLLALSSNIGDYSSNEFTVLPELSFTLGYAMSPRSRFLVGYTFVYWNHVVRAGDVVDTTVNPDLIPPAQPTDGPNRPAFAFSDTSFWAQGLSLGLDYRW